MKVTPEILDAIDRASDYYGNITLLAQNLGIAHSTILFWRSGKTTNISGKLWMEKIHQGLKPFMPGGIHYKEIESLNPAKYMVREERAAYGMPPEPQPVSSVVVTAFEKFAEFDPLVESPVSFAKKNPYASGTTGFACKLKDEYFALAMDESVKSMFPMGTTFLIAWGEYPQDCGIVAAKLRDSGQIVIAHFQKQDAQIKLAVLGTKKVYEWPAKENSLNLVWVYPVHEIRINLSENRWIDNRLVPLEEKQAAPCCG